MSLKHALVVNFADDPAAVGKLRPSNWGSPSTDYSTAPTHVFDGGALGSLAMRDTGSVDGFSWLPSAAGVLVNDGLGALAWTMTPTVTSVTATGTLLVGASAMPTGPDPIYQNIGALFNVKNTIFGDGRVVSAPTGVIVAVAGAAGNVNGTVGYAYTETCNGETTISPITSITVANKQVTLTLPAIRRGMVTRKIYRTTNGGLTLKLLFEHDGGNGLQQKTYVDNALDAALGADAPAVNTTQFYSAWIGDGVKYLSTHPDQGGSSADLTVLTAQGDGSTGYAMDLYGPMMVRTHGNGSSYMSLAQDSFAHFIGYSTNPTFGDLTATPVFKVGGKGHLFVAVPDALSDPVLGDGKALAFSVAATFGAANTSNANAISFGVTGAGNQAFRQIAVAINLAAGYTGTSRTNGLVASNATAAGTAIGCSGIASGVAAASVGVYGDANSTATSRHFGGFFTNNSIAPEAVAVPGSGVTGAALAATNGSGSNDIFVAYDNLDPVFRVANQGDIFFQSPAGDSSFSARFQATSGGGIVEIAVAGGTSASFGSTNNVPLLIKTNNATVATFSTGGGFGIGVTPTAVLHLKAGTATANTAPVKFTSGTVLTTAEAGAVEFTTDTFFATITTGAARKGIVLDDGARLTSGKIPVASTNGRLIDGPTPLAGTKTYWVSDSSGGAVNRKLTFTDGILTAEV